MASSGENESSDGEVKTFKSYIQVPKKIEPSKRSRRSRSHSTRGGNGESLQRQSDSDDEYYERRQKVQKFMDSKQRRLNKSERDKENYQEEKAYENREYDDDASQEGDDMKQRDKKIDRGRGKDKQKDKDTDRHRDRERDRDREKDKYRDGDRHRNRDKDWKHGQGYDSMVKKRGHPQRNYKSRDRSAEKYKREIRQEKERQNIVKERYTELKAEREKRKADESLEQDLPKQPEHEDDNAKEIPEKKKDSIDILSRTGGAYIPPARLRMLQESITDKTSVAYQRMAWEALKKSINGLVNKINVANIANIVQELFEENIIRGRGIFCQSVMRAQVASPIFTNVYAALIAIVNTKFPKIGELILRRLILQFRRAFRRNDKTVCLSSAKFIAHLVNQQVAHELLSLEVLTLLLQKPTNDSVEVAIAFLKEVGMKLSEVSPRGINAVFERLRSILNESAVEKRVQYMIEVMFAVRKDGFKDHQAIIPELDHVEEDDQITHLLRLDDDGATEDITNVFKEDPQFEENEEKYKMIKREIIGQGSEDESSEVDSDEENEEDETEGDEEKMDIIDKTETNLVALRRSIYLTIQSSLDYEECAHKMMKMNLKPGQEHEFCQMIIDCCAQQRTYEKFFGLLAQDIKHS